MRMFTQKESFKYVSTNIFYTEIINSKIICKSSVLHSYSKIICNSSVIKCFVQKRKLCIVVFVKLSYDFKT